VIKQLMIVECMGNIMNNFLQLVTCSLNGCILKASLSWTWKKSKVEFEWCKKFLSVFVSFLH